MSYFKIMWQMHVRTDTKEIPNHVRMSVKTSYICDFPVSNRIAWHEQIQASMQLVQIQVSVYCLVSIKVTGKSVVG